MAKQVKQVPEGETAPEGKSVTEIAPLPEVEPLPEETAHVPEVETAPEVKSVTEIVPLPEVEPLSEEIAHVPEEPEGEDTELKKMIEAAKRIFRTHPQAEELHFASDGTAFFEPFPAKNYANKLKDTEVTPVKRKSIKF
jgi:hypothetical protein